MTGTEGLFDQADRWWHETPERPDGDGEVERVVATFDPADLTEALGDYYRQAHQALIVLQAEDVALFVDLLEHRISVAGFGDYADALTDLRHRLIAALIGPTDEQEEGGEW